MNNLYNLYRGAESFAMDNCHWYPPQSFSKQPNSRDRVGVANRFLILSNELKTAALFHCPADKKRKPAESFAELSDKNVSYFVSLSEGTPQSFLIGDRNVKSSGVAVKPGVFSMNRASSVSWSSQVHSGYGMVLLRDGSIDQWDGGKWEGLVMSGRMLAETNILAVP